MGVGKKAGDPADLVMDEDPGRHFLADVPDGSGGTRRRHYVDALELGEDIRKRALTSIRAPDMIQIARDRRAPAAKDSSQLRIGYAFWGFLGDHKEDAKGNALSTPDGNATYSWSIVWEAMRRGHQVIPMMLDRDYETVQRRGYSNFGAFANEMRWKSYVHLSRNGILHDSYHDFPELDVLLVEWRWPIPGRNTPDQKGAAWYQPDLERQTALLEHYSGTKTKVVAWDLDHKMTMEDEQRWRFSVFETSVLPRKFFMSRLRVEPPTIVDVLLSQPTEAASPGNLLAYIGSRYERDEIIDEWIRATANRDRARGRYHFYGKWEQPDCSIRWPGVAFHDRVTVADFPSIYASACGVPLLAKRSYIQNGFVTPRVWEALMFGSIPIGLYGHFGISRYVDKIADDDENMLEIAEELSQMSLEERHETRRKAVEKIGFMDARYFLNKLESLL